MLVDLCWLKHPFIHSRSNSYSLTLLQQVPSEIRAIDRAEYDFELDGWGRWDMPSDDYYDLQAFPESYTGYDGSEIWQFIHERICFAGCDEDDTWKADFNKAVSGLHAMVSAQVTIGIQDKLESGEAFTDAEVWRDPKVEFERRLGVNGETPLAMENLYFCYMLLLRAVKQSRERLLQDCSSGKIGPETSEALQAVFASSLMEEPAVDVAFNRLHDHAVNGSKETLWEARMRTRELLRIMNCVQCNKCRLHGKISVMGLSTALQILVGRSGTGGDPKRIHRVELAALMATLHKFATAVQFCNEMQR